MRGGTSGRRPATRKRYAVVGTGERALEMYVRPLAGPFADVGELVALYDPNPLRARAVAELAGVEVAICEDFAGLLGSRPDVVIVTSVDATHHRYIVEALRAGCDVVTEKPLTVDADRCRAILAAVRETGRDVRVAFNYRYAPVFTAVKEQLASGAIGEVRSVDFHWYLDTRHGADYFRRWHRRMANSGGLFVHKATHHFDLVNWWIDDRPEAVLAEGGLLVYGASGPFRGSRCRGCAHADGCAFRWDVTDEDEYRQLYVEAEAADGYVRDGCVFDPEVDIFDTMAAIVRYRRGARMSYSCNAYMAYEGMRAAFNGATGRLEVEVIESRDVDADEVRIYRPRIEDPELVLRVPRAGDDHGGGDARLLDHLFRGREDDPLGHAAGVEAGADSILVGVAANRSVATGGWVAIDDLLAEPRP
jgi:predicted dehydrogenase